MPLSDLGIRKAKAEPDRTIKLSDGGGLQLWISATGSKLWYLAYRFEGKQKKLAIGPYPAVTLAQAREQRDQAKALLRDDIDPAAHKKAARQARHAVTENTFGRLARELLDKKAKEGKAAKTVSKNEWLLSLAAPELGELPIEQINAPAILATLRKVETRGRIETAHRLRSVIGEVFRYAIATGRAQADPTGALRGALMAPKTTHRPAITDEKGFGGLLRTIDGYNGSPEIRIALQLLALTLVRPGELRHARWQEIDMDKAVWSIPAERMKMRRPHRVPLAPQSLALLNQLRQFTGHRDLLFPGTRSHLRPISENTLNAALRRLGYGKDEMTSHGFRSSASSLLNESGLWNPDAIEAQLSHVDKNSIRRAYARAEYWDERVRMMDWWASKITHLQLRQT